jgi:two-component system response regulator FixJ
MCGGLIHVVDDEDAIRRSLEFLLRAAGYRVQCWADGEDFLQRVDKTIPACVLLDIRMPIIDGLEVQKRMTENGFDFPVIMMTGHGDIALAVQTMMAGAADFMEKPFDREKLLRSLAVAFERLADRISLREEQAAAAAQIARLTESEREVLDGLACGLRKQTIGDDLGLSLPSVEVNRANLMAKLQVTYFADALRIALKGGLGAEKEWRDKHGAGQKPAE